MKRRVANLIWNPRSGREGAERVREVERFCKRLDALGVKTEPVSTTGPRDAMEMAARAVSEGAREVIVSGGDGTINEALQGLVGSEARLSVWPRGTANVLAREIGLPPSLEANAEIIARGLTRRIHLGCATIDRTGERRYFILMAGVGLDASVVRNVRPSLKRRGGELAYWYAGIEHLVRWPPPSFTLEAEGEKIPARFAIVANGAGYGGRLLITPRARLDSPEFEVCLTNSSRRFDYVSLLSHAMRRGVPERLAGVRFIRTCEVRATGNVFVQADGELIGQLPMKFRVSEHTIEITTP